MMNSEQNRKKKGWCSRGYLPHFDQDGLVQHITFRLADSLPKEVITRWKSELGWKESSNSSSAEAKELRKRISQYEDSCHGKCVLRDPRNAQIVQDTLLFHDGHKCSLLRWCIMPNHVHVLVEINAASSIAELVQIWKSYSARRINSQLGRKGPLWQKDYHDRFVRDEQHFQRTAEYIDKNPIEAGLCERPEEWRFSTVGYWYQQAKLREI